MLWAGCCVAQLFPFPGPGGPVTGGGTGPTPALLTSSAIANAVAGATATTAAIDTTGATLLVACVSGYNVNSAGSILTDSASNIWSKLTDPGFGQSGMNNTNTIWYVTSPTTSATHTISVTSGYPSISLASFSGTRASSPQDVTPTSSGAYNSAAQTLQPGSITPTQNLDLIVTCGNNGGTAAATPTINSPMTLIRAQNDASGGRNALAFYYYVQASASAFNPTYSSNQGTNANIQVTETSFKNQ